MGNRKTIEGESMVRRSWKEKRTQQGYSYDSILAEMRRRFEGERVLSGEEAKTRFEHGVKKLEQAFRLSAGFCDVIDREKLSYGNIQEVLGIRDDNCLLMVLLDPVSCGKHPRRSLRNNEEVDRFYPGDDMPRNMPRKK